MNSKPTAIAIALCVGTLLFGLCLPGRAQSTRVPRIGYLTSASQTTALPSTRVFRDGLRQMGYVEGKNIVIEWRYAEGQNHRLSELAAELVKLNVAVIVTGATPAIRAVQHATTTIPIIMTNVGDPVAEGF